MNDRKKVRRIRRRIKLSKEDICYFCDKPASKDSELGLCEDCEKEVNEI